MPGNFRRKQQQQKPKKKTNTTSSSNTSGSTTTTTNNNISENIETLLERVYNLKSQYEHELCMKALSKGIQQFKNNPRVYELQFLLGEIYLEQGDPLNATVFLKQAIQSNPQHFPSYMYLGQVSQGKTSVDYFSKGLILIEEAVKNQNNNQQIPIEELQKLYIQGLCSICELYMTDLCFEPNAEQECERCVELAKNMYQTTPLEQWDIHLLQTLSHLRMCQNKPEEGKVMMQVVAKNIIDEGNRLKEEQTGYSEMLNNYDFKLSTSKNLIELQMYQEAKEILEQLKENFDEVVDLWYLLGICHDCLGKTEIGIQCIERALKVGKKVQEDGMFLKEVKEELNLMKEKLKNQGITVNELKDNEDDEEAWEDVVEEMALNDEDENVEMNDE
ncbi:hypothetical protein ABK040_001591 [Willaertia magna]